MLGTVAILWVAASVTPGPDFLLVSRVSVTQGRAEGLRAAAGVTLGIAVWSVAGFFGIHALFAAEPWLYAALKLGGGAYLLYLGLRLLAGSRRHAAVAALPASGRGRGFRLGLVTNLANPKAPIFVSSLFAVAMPPHPPATLGLAAIGIMVAITALWYVLVARFLSQRRIAAGFARARHWIDRVAGLAFMTFGTRLVLDRSS